MGSHNPSHPLADGKTGGIFPAISMVLGTPISANQCSGCENANLACAQRSLDSLRMVSCIARGTIFSSRPNFVYPTLIEYPLGGSNSFVERARFEGITFPYLPQPPRYSILLNVISILNSSFHLTPILLILICCFSLLYRLSCTFLLAGFPWRLCILVDTMNLIVSDEFIIQIASHI
jgi:hypothetical protein